MLFLAPMVFMGCTTSQARKAPPVVEEAPPPVEKSWMDQTAESTQHVADNTWKVVSGTGAYG